MKLLLIAALVAVGTAHLDSDPDNHLHHFDKASLSESMQNYQFPSEAGCDAETQTCMAQAHQHAMKCVDMWHDSLGDSITNCETNDEEVKEADEAWQEASAAYHKALDDCLKGETPPEDSSEERFGYFFRKKRHADDEEGPDDNAHVEEEYETYQACFTALHRHRRHCKRHHLASCPRFVICNGMGNAPEDAESDDAKWYNHVKKLRETKHRKVRAHRRKLHECMEREDENLWDDNSQL